MVTTTLYDLLGMRVMQSMAAEGRFHIRIQPTEFASPLDPGSPAISKTISSAGRSDRPGRQHLDKGGLWRPNERGVLIGGADPRKDGLSRSGIERRTGVLELSEDPPGGLCAI